MDNVNNLLEGASPYQMLQEQAGKLASKWDKSGLLEGIESSTEKNNMSMLLENQAKQLVNEANTTGTGTSISTGNSEAWAGVALPLVRRVFGEIVAKDLVSVQPMNLPAGLIFYLDFQYGSAGTTNAANESLYGATSDLKRTDGAFNKGLYGAGEFGYSMHTTSSVINAIGTLGGGTSGTTTYETGSFVHFDQGNGDTEFSSSNVGLFLDVAQADGTSGGNNNMRVFTVKAATSSLNDFDIEGLRAFKVSDENGHIDEFFPQFTRINGGDIEFVVKVGTAGQGSSLGKVTIEYQK